MPTAANPGTGLSTTRPRPPQEATQRPPQSAYHPFEALSDLHFQIVHPRCSRPILILELWLCRNSTLRVRGICYHCDCYVHLEHALASSDPARG